ncbi:MAG TPA: hypothetical protein PLQ49_09425, partial [Methanothrix sp.]|nr:hypothetical protein [Methanothrix sp.]
FTWTYLEDQVKYRLLCEESFSLAKLMNWTKPVLEYYKNLMVSSELDKCIPSDAASFEEGGD